MRARPTVLFARSQVRRHWPSLLGLMVLVALAGAFALTAATGARRVATAWPRFEAATRSPNLIATVPVDQLEATAARLRAQPGVDGVSAVAWLPIRPRELDDPAQGGFAAMSTGFGTDVYRAQVLDGRLADQTRADEFTINPALARMTGLRIGDRTTSVSPVPGVEIDATALRQGRTHAGPREVALSSQGMKALQAKIGDEISIDSPTGSHQFTLVGTAIYPQLHNADWGGAGSVTRDAIQAMGLDTEASVLLVDVAPGHSLADVRAVFGPDISVRTPSPPPVIDNLREAVPIIRVLAIFLALLGAATLAHALVTGSHRRRRDHATARAIGLTGRQLTAAFGWHSATIALVAVVAGLPLGIVTGAIAWRLSTRNLGVLDMFAVPPVATSSIAVATFVVAVFGAFTIAINARRAPLVASLRTE